MYIYVWHKVVYATCIEEFYFVLECVPEVSCIILKYISTLFKIKFS